MHPAVTLQVANVQQPHKGYITAVSYSSTNQLYSIADDQLLLKHSNNAQSSSSTSTTLYTLPSTQYSTCMTYIKSSYNPIDRQIDGSGANFIVGTSDGC